MKERKDVLLKAAYDLLKQCETSVLVEDPMFITVHYDEADCDGACLMQDIADELDISE